MFGSTVGFRGRRIEWRYFRFRQIQDDPRWRRSRNLEKFKWRYLRGRRIIRFTPRLVLGRGFRGRRIEWRYIRFRQIQDGGAAAILKNSNGDISAADHRIYSVFGFSMGFSGSADFNGANSGLTNARGVIRLVTI